jgi:hypothetical protein
MNCNDYRIVRKNYKLKRDVTGILYTCYQSHPEKQYTLKSDTIVDVLMKNNQNDYKILTKVKIYPSKKDNYIEPKEYKFIAFWYQS